MLKVLSVLVLIFCILGCESLVRVGPTIQDNATIIRTGTPATIIDKQNTEVLESNDGKVQIIDKNTRKIVVEGKVTSGDLSGLCVIDQATLDYYLALHRLFKDQFLQMQAQQKLTNPVK